MISVDLNCDMGEGCPNDLELMSQVSSVNIACGFHAGDVATMCKTVENAVENNVAIGAHPSFPDRKNFGRTTLTMPLTEIYEIVSEQIESLRQICSGAGAILGHVKPHGALYNQSARDGDLAAIIAKAIRDNDQNLVLYGLSGSLSIIEAEKIGLCTASEAFADRTYSADGSLTPRSSRDALITDAETAAKQAVKMVTSGTIVATDGTNITIKADTICIHGDGKHALEFAIAIRRRLLENGINIRPINV